MKDDGLNNEDLDVLAKELGLNADSSDFASLRSEIRARISELHPDHQTEDPDARLKQLVTLLRKTGSETRELATLNRASQITKRENAVTPITETIEVRLDALRTSRQTELSRRFLFPKISLGTLAAALAWVFIFPQSFADHPYIGQILKGRYAPGIWLAVVLILATAWLVVSTLEQRNQRRVERLLSLTYQKSTLGAVGRRRSGIFSTSEFQETLCQRDTWYPGWLRLVAKNVFRKNLYFYTRTSYDAALVERTTELAIERFMKKGWIVRTERPEDETGVDDWYRTL